jgi:hypothetical protein
MGFLCPPPITSKEGLSVHLFEISQQNTETPTGLLLWHGYARAGTGMLVKAAFPDEIFKRLSPEILWIKGVVKIEDEILDEVGMEGFCVMMTHSLEKCRIPVQQAEILDQILV